MKKLFSKISRRVAVISATLAALVACGAIAYASFGPDRPTRVWTPQENGFDYVTFDSYTNVPNGIGDERDFLRGVDKGRDSQWQDPVSNVANNDVVTAKIYIHNNADPLLNDQPGQPGVAKDVTVKIEIPTGLATEHDVKSSIYASNAQPKTIFDTLSIDSLNKSLFQLNYVPGSAKLGGQTLSDEIFKTGLNIGDQKGCFEYVREITFEMKVEKPGYKIQKTARLKGEDSSKWREDVNAKVGDTIEWRISFDNTGSTQLNDVAVVDDLPAYNEVVPNTVELVNSNFPNGYKYGSNAVQNNGDMVNVSIDDYMPGSNAYVYLETKIKDDESLKCGNHRLTNTVYVTPNGLGTVNDTASVIINGAECVQTVTNCVDLTAPTLTLKKGESTTFTATGESNNNVTITGYKFSVDGKVVQNSNKNTYTYKAETVGNHDVSVAILFSNNDEKTSNNCKKTVKVVDETKLVYTCYSLKASLVKDMTFKFQVSTTAMNGATVKSYKYNFGDKTEELMTDKSTVEHSYAKAGEYTASVKVTFDVNGKLATVDGQNCVVKVKTSQVKGTTTTLPNTGAGDTFGILMAVAVLGTLAHRRYTLKNLGR